MGIFNTNTWIAGALGAGLQIAAQYAEGAAPLLAQAGLGTNGAIGLVTGFVYVALARARTANAAGGGLLVGALSGAIVGVVQPYLPDASALLSPEAVAQTTGSSALGGVIGGLLGRVLIPARAPRPA